MAKRLLPASKTAIDAHQLDVDRRNQGLDFLPARLQQGLIRGSGPAQIGLRLLARNHRSGACAGAEGEIGGCHPHPRRHLRVAPGHPLQKGFKTSQQCHCRGPVLRICCPLAGSEARQLGFQIACKSHIERGEPSGGARSSTRRLLQPFHCLLGLLDLLRLNEKTE